MAVSDGMIIVWLVIFMVMLYMAIQQLFIERMDNHKWILYRIGVLISVLNENIILIILLTVSFDNNSNSGLTIMMRALVWINNIIGTYLIYRIVMLGIGWVYKQLNINTEIPKSFSWIFGFFLSSSALILFVCLIISLVAGNDQALQIHDVYSEIFIMILNLFGSLLPLRVGYQLTQIIKRTQQAHRQSSQTDTSHISSNHSNENDSGDNNKDGGKYLSKRERTLKRLRKAKNRMFFTAILLFFIFLFSLLNTMSTINDFNDNYNNPENLSVSIYQDSTSFSAHFIFSVGYELLLLIAVYQSTKCCMDRELSDNSFFILILHCQGNKNANCHHRIWPLSIYYDYIYNKKHAKKVNSKSSLATGGANDKADGTKNNNKETSLNKDSRLQGQSNVRGSGQGDDELDLTLVLHHIDEVDDLRSNNNNNSERWESHKYHNKLQATDQITSLLREETPTQGDKNHDFREPTMLHIETADLDQIDREGRKIGKRKKKKAQKTSKERKKLMRENRNKLKPMTEETKDSTKYMGLQKKEETYAPYDAVSQIEQSANHGIVFDGRINSLENARSNSSNNNTITNTNSNRSHLDTAGALSIDMKVAASGDDLIDELLKDVAVQASENSDEDDGGFYPTIIEPIKLVIYEFENVLATNMKHITGKNPKEMQAVDLNKMLLSFGMVDRLEMLHEQFCEVIMNGNENRMCFALTQETSQTIFKVFERVDFAQYFVSLNPNAKTASGKKLSHVIGRDHKLYQESEGKKHLLVLRLMKFLKCTHENILYIGHDKDVIQHLTENNFCQTYYCKTEGLVFHDLARIENIFFPKERTDDEKDTSDYHTIARNELKEAKAKEKEKQNNNNNNDNNNNDNNNNDNNNNDNNNNSNNDNVTNDNTKNNNTTK